MFSRSHVAAASLAALLPLTAPAMAAPTSWTLTKVSFVGNAQVPTSELEAALPFKPGDRIDRAGVGSETDAVGQVYQKHNVAVNISDRLTALGSKATLTYTLAEQAPAPPAAAPSGITADSVSVTGNSRISTATILTAANIQPGGQVDNAKLQAAQNAIVALYKKKNIGVSVQSDFTNLAPQHVAIIFRITESAH